MFCVGSLMSQVLQYKQFCAWIQPFIMASRTPDNGASVSKHTRLKRVLIPSACQVSTIKNLPSPAERASRGLSPPSRHQPTEPGAEGDRAAPDRERQNAREKREEAVDCEETDG